MTFLGGGGGGDDSGRVVLGVCLGYGPSQAVRFQFIFLADSGGSL